MSDGRDENIDTWKSLLADVLGVRKLAESRFDQLVELVRATGDPHAEAAEFDTTLAIRYYEALEAAYRRLQEVDA